MKVDIVHLSQRGWTSIGNWKCISGEDAQNEINLVRFDYGQVEKGNPKKVEDDEDYIRSICYKIVEWPTRMDPKKK